MDETPKDKFKPLFVVKPGTMTREDITRAEQSCGIIVIECADPESVRFLDAPVDAEMGIQARAAVELMRMIVTGTTINYSRDWLSTWFVNALLREQRPREVKRLEKVKK